MTETFNPFPAASLLNGGVQNSVPRKTQRQPGSWRTSQPYAKNEERGSEYTESGEGHTNALYSQRSKQKGKRNKTQQKQGSAFSEGSFKEQSPSARCSRKESESPCDSEPMATPKEGEAQTKRKRSRSATFFRVQETAPGWELHPEHLGIRCKTEGGRKGGEMTLSFTPPPSLTAAIPKKPK